MLGYLDSNQEQLMRAGLPVSEASLPHVPHDFAEVGECSLPVAAGYYGLLLALSEGLWHPKWHLLKFGLPAEALCSSLAEIIYESTRGGLTMSSRFASMHLFG